MTPAEMEEQAAKIGLDPVNHFNYGIAGPSGSGKVGTASPHTIVWQQW
jgi:hypothetical protein